MLRRMDQHLSNSTWYETVVIINCVLNVPFMLISIIGNTLVLAAIVRTPSLRSPSIVFLCNLAVSDLFVGLIVQPFYIADQLKPNSPRLLFARQTVQVIACGVSICTMAAISVDRILALRYHLRYPSLMTIKRAIYTSSALWCINIILSCVRFWNSNIYYLSMTGGIANCFLISSYCYVRIYLIVRRHQLQIHSQQQAMEILNAEDNLNVVRSKKSAINTFIYYICMILCYLPTLISTLYLAILSNRWTKAWTLADTVAFMNSSINPMLYCWRTRELRTAVLRTLRNILFKQP